MSRNTKATIVSTALKLVGSAASDLQAEAELWLDLILQDAAQNYRFPDLQRQHSAAVATGTSTVTYPTDYGFLVKDGTQRGAVGYLLDSSGTRASVFERTLSDIQIPDAAAVPVVADNRYAGCWATIMPVGGTLYLAYQAVPVAVASDAVVWYPNDLELVQQVKFLAEMYMRGNLLNVAAQVKEAARVLSLRAPSRLTLWQGGPGADLDSRWFR